MTQEEKDLLLKDLCARLPYGVKVHAKYIDTDTYVEVEKVGVLSMIDTDIVVAFTTSDDTNCYNYVSIHEVKPYLFPLSSISEKQRFELKKQHSKDSKILQEICKEIYTNMNLDKSGLGVTYNAEDWCNANNFDYRGLIPMGLALDATGLNIY